MLYNECNVITKLVEKNEPLITEVPTDAFTELISKNFDYEFDGKSKFYPFIFPSLPDFNICCVVGASGSGKTVMLKEILKEYNSSLKEYNDNAIISNFNTAQEAFDRLTAVGLNSLPVWCRPRRVLSVGEGFRADMALNIGNYMIFDEFTSTIDRNVAKSTCKGLHDFIVKNNLNHIIFSSCHKDFIPYLKPDFVIDLDDKKVYDCRGADLGETLSCTSTNPIPKMCGTYLGSITI